ncbi:MAG: hypothetical protein WBC91_08905 [Phototrophicaceae bacterium]
MQQDLFSYSHDENFIWNVQFNSASREAIQQYIETITQINAQIVSGSIITNHPVLILWDFTQGYFPKMQNVILQARMQPPPPELAYRIAYLLNSQTLVLEFNAFRHYLNVERVERRIFKGYQKADAVAWLLEATSPTSIE